MGVRDRAKYLNFLQYSFTITHKGLFELGNKHSNLGPCDVSC